MNVPIHNRPLLFVMTLLALVTIPSLACSFSGIGIHGTTPVVEVAISQDELNMPNDHGPLHAEFHWSGHCRNLLDEVSRVELHDGFIRYIGIKHQEDGSVTDGSLDLYLGAENGLLQTKIIAVDIPNFDLNHPCITEFNKEAEEEFRRLVRDSQGEVLFKEVEVTENVLRMKIQVNINIEPGESMNGIDIKFQETP